jgi:DNA invertase Pin-like site-specific DNA recombinase
MTMIVKYQRTSTVAQHGERFTVDKGHYDLTLFDKGISGTLPFAERTHGAKVLQLVKEGKIKELVVSEIRDIGRNTRDTINTLGILEDAGVIVRIQNLGNLQSFVDGKKNPAYTLIITTLASIYEMELENIRWRCKMGLENYLAKGGKLGRKNGTRESLKSFLSKEKSIAIASLIHKGKSVRDIAGRLGVSTSTVIKVRRAMVETGVLVAES